MSEKTIIYSPEGAGYGSNGLDPNLWMSMMNNGGMGGFGGGNFLAILFLIAIFGRNGFNSGNYDLNYIATQLSNGFQGDANAINNLSTQLNCSIGQVQTGIAAVQSAIQNVSNQTGMTGMQIINAVNSGDANIISTLQSCCCDLKTTVNNQGYENRINNLQQSQLIQNGFSQIGYAAAEQTNVLGGKIDRQTTLINDKFCQLEMREMQNKLDSERQKNLALTNQLSQEHQNALFATMITPIQQRLADIECKLPDVARVPYSPVVGIPSCVAYNYGLNALGLAGFNSGIVG